MDKTLGLIAVVIVAVVIAAAVYLLNRSRKENDCHFDERQITLRAKGTQIGFFVTLIAEMAALFLLELGILPLASATLAVFTALMIGIVTFAVFCISKDVFFRIGEKGGYYIGLSAAIVVLDGWVWITRLLDGTVTENGCPTFEGCNALIMALSFLVILAALLIRRFAGERDE